jgi:hypothetical protein
MLIPVATPTHPVEPTRFALLDLGFRPFYLLAGAYAALAARRHGRHRERIALRIVCMQDSNVCHTRP